ncbi:hypothetical protein F5Y01DRAFT_294093 [Xylaria sp. FL0043]|nr:hypothetical protein F5Y01DRAFT_294093 [Xylaria sp. FL0043]
MAAVENHAPAAREREAPRRAGQRRDQAAARPHKISLHQLYALPAPIRTFPLPSFYPNNPLSLFHVIWAWARQVLCPPAAEPSAVHEGCWSPETRSVHIRDPKSIRALWEQGFFGKGSYSRSEPNWLKREQNRQGQGEKRVSELITAQRRQERQMMKWDRARKEQEAILRTRLEEAWVAPVGPKELLALPNSLQDLLHLSPLAGLTNGHSTPGSVSHPSALQTQVSSNGEVPHTSISAPSTPKPMVNGDRVGDRVSEPAEVSLNGNNVPNALGTPATKPGRSSSSNAVASTLKRRKSVRFSPTVESATFKLGDPPSPHLKSLSNGKIPNGEGSNGNLPMPQSIDATPAEILDVPVTAESVAPSPNLVDREHLQLTLEEAFYLVFGLGALTVIDPATEKVMSTQELFYLCRQMSYFPGGKATLRPDDPFLIQYAVYHHFRSLGWVPRPGIKFGVDWLLYMGGPVFAHAEFAVTVLPAYTDPYWKSQGHEPPKKSWHWLHSINRVQSHALKTMVLVYVDIPPPTDTQDPSALLKRYRIREFVMKRWSSNRSRD